MPLNELKDRSVFVSSYSDFADKMAAAVKRRAVLADNRILNVAHQRWLIQRSIIEAQLENPNETPPRVKVLSHLKELATLLPCLALVNAFSFPSPTYDTSIETTTDPELKARNEYMRSAPNSYLAWEFCYKIFESYEIKRSLPKGDRKTLFEPRITFDLYDDIIRGLEGGHLNSIGCFYLLKSIAARH